MKDNKRYGLLFSLLLMAAAGVAQAQPQVSATVGTHYSKVIFEDEADNRQEAQFTLGWHIGLSVDVPVGRALYIQPGLLYSQKGFTQEDSWFAGSGNNFEVNAHYLDLSVNFLYKPAVGSGHVLLGGGPYAAYGLGGAWESDEDVVIGDIVIGDHGEVHFSNDAMDGGDGNSYLYGRPLDYGANLLVGYEFFNRISAQFNVQLGLANIIPEYADGTTRDGSVNNIALGVSLGYKL